MQSTKEKYTTLLSAIAALLSKYGYKKRANTFYLHSDKNWGLLNIQKGQSSSIEEIIFTINLGVCSGRLLEFEKQELLNKKPDFVVCHWKKRIGFLTPEKKDKWWVINNSTDYSELSAEVLDLISSGHREVVNFITDDSLQKLWLTGHSDGLTNLQRLLNLTVLLKLASNESLLQDTINELLLFSNNKPSSTTVKIHLKELNDITIP